MKQAIALDVLENERAQLTNEEIDELTWFSDKDYYDEKPVPIDVFCEDSHFLRASFWGKRDQLLGFNPWWLDVLKRIYPTSTYTPYVEIIGLLPIGSGKCLREGTLVPTNMGVLPIDKIHERFQNGEKFSVMSEEGVCPVKETVFDGFKKVFEITTNYGRSLFPTSEHRFRVLSKTGDIEWRKTKDLATGDLLLVSRKTISSEKDPLVKGLPYFLGALTGDGWVTLQRGERKNVGFITGYDCFDFEEEFVNEIFESFNAFVGDAEWGDGFGGMTLRKVSESFSELLYETGFLNKIGYEKRIPVCILDGCDFDKVEYLAGLIDTDGSVSENKSSIEITTKYEFLARDLVSLLSSLGLKFNKTEKIVAKKIYHRFVIVGKESFKRLLQLNLYLRISYKRESFMFKAFQNYNRNDRDILPFGLRDRIKSVYEKASKNRGGSKSFAREKNKNLWGGLWGKRQNFSLQTLRKIRELLPDEFNEDSVLTYLLDNDCYLDKIVSIEELQGDYPVYDLSVGRSPSYFVDGLISHNTTTAIVSLAYEIYKLQCLKNPHHFYNIRPPGTKIVFSLFSTALNLADDVNWKIMESLIQDAPWFKKRGILQGKNIKLKTKDTVHMGKNLWVDLGSSSRHALGKAVWGACFTGDTKLPLLDGRVVRFDSLVNDIFPKEKEVYVHSYDNIRKEFVPGRVKKAFFTGEKSVFRIHLDSGKFFDATEDQLILCRDNKYRRVDVLKEGQALLSALFTRKSGYRVFTDPFTAYRSCVMSYNAKVVKVEYLGVKKTYDLTVDHPCHNFIIDAGVFCHNCLDEANFQMIKSAQAYKSYVGILRRMESRFLEQKGRIPGILWLISSPEQTSDFLEKHISSSENAKRKFKVPFAPIWEIQGYRSEELYAGETFRVFVGDKIHDPVILYEKEASEFMDPDDVFEVPIEYKEAFETDLRESIQDIIGRTAKGSFMFFGSAEKVNSVMTMPERFTREIIKLDFANKRDRVEEYVVEGDYFKKPSFPECFRFLHLDLAYSDEGDRAGLAGVFATNEKRFEMTGRTEGKKPVGYDRKFRQFFVDFVVVLQANKGEQIPIHQITSFIQFLKNCRYPIRKITADRFQSVQFLQDVKLMGYESAHLSMDDTRSSKAKWVDFRNSVYDGTLFLPKHELLREELLDLRDKGKHVDHSTDGSKDAADAVAGAFIGCFTADVIFNPQAVKEDHAKQKEFSVKEAMFQQKKRESFEQFFGKHFLNNY